MSNIYSLNKYTLPKDMLDATEELHDRIVEALLDADKKGLPVGLVVAKLEFLKAVLIKNHLGD